MRRAFRHFDAKNFLTLYKVFVSPKLEYCLQAASLERENELLKSSKELQLS